MMELKIGYHITYKDPKTTKEEVGLVLNFDADMVIVWKEKHPYAIPRIQVVKGYENMTKNFEIQST